MHANHIQQGDPLLPQTLQFQAQARINDPESKQRPRPPFEPEAKQRPEPGRRSRSRSRQRRSPSDRRGASGCAKGKGKDKGKGKGKGKGGKFREVQISKTLARVLRHTASSLGLHIREDGFCLVSEILSVQEFVDIDCSVDDLRQIVSGNDKQRFEIREEAGKLLVRATQGHSMKSVQDESLLEPLVLTSTLPQVCVHGTYHRYLQSIMQKGLLPGGGNSDRNHVHFAPYEPGDGRVISGIRYNCEVAIYLDLQKALQEGVPFFKSTNEVILSPGVNGIVAAKYFKGVRDLKQGTWLFGGA